MSVWQCGRCFALHFTGERLCRRCGAPRPTPSIPTIVPREPGSAAVHLTLPAVDFPYSRRAQTRERRRFGPLILLLLAGVIAVGWDPFVRKVAADRALGGDSAAAVDGRRRELRYALNELSGLLATRAAGAVEDPEAWRAEVRTVARRWRLDGNNRSPEVGELEVRVRALWLEVASLPEDQKIVAPHAKLAREELSRLTEDLSNAR